MRGTLYIAAAVAALAIPLPASAKDDDYVYGPEPSWESFRQIAEAGVIARLIDPDSAKISWLSGMHKGGLKPLLQGKVRGYLACGMVNAKNRMGGYTGAQTFAVVIDHGRLLFADIDRTPYGLITDYCNGAMRDGLLPPVPIATSATPSPASPPTSGSGLSLRPMPEGAYVSAVASGSRAENAGLKPGMVIEAVNAIPLKTMGEAMLALVEAAGPNASLSIIGGRTVRLGDQ